MDILEKDIHFVAMDEEDPPPAQESIDAIAELYEKAYAKKKPRAFIVLGLEGAGTYMIHNALVKAECLPLAYEEEGQIVDNLGLDISIRQSFPHAGRWPDWDNLLRRCQQAKYEVFIVWIIREQNARILSVLRRDSTRDTQHLLEYQASFFKELNTTEDYGGVDYQLITYSAFVHSEGFRRWLFEERLQLPYPEDFEVRDENAKYY